MNETVDIIIPTINRSIEIKECLDSIRRQTTKPDNIIIVDASDSNTLSQIIKKEYPDLTIKYVASEKGLPHQRNIGIKFIKSEWVLFLDDDIVLESDFIAKAFKQLREKKVYSVLTGRIINHGKNIKVNPLLIQFQKFFFLSESKDGFFKKSGVYNSKHPSINEPVEVEVAIGGLSLYSHNIFSDYQFDTAYQYIAGYASFEDEDFSLQIKNAYRILYSPQCQAIHNHHTAPETRLSVYRRGKIIAFNHRYLYRKHRSEHNFKAFPHFLSCFGFIIEALLNRHSASFCLGIISGYLIFMKKKSTIERKVNDKTIRSG